MIFILEAFHMLEYIFQL